MQDAVGPAVQVRREACGGDVCRIGPDAPIEVGARGEVDAVEPADYFWWGSFERSLEGEVFGVFLRVLLWFAFCGGGLCGGRGGACFLSVELAKDAVAG